MAVSTAVRPCGPGHALKPRSVASFRQLPEPAFQSIGLKPSARCGSPRIRAARTPSVRSDLNPAQRRFAHVLWPRRDPACSSERPVVGATLIRRTIPGGSRNCVARTTCRHWRLTLQAGTGAAALVSKLPWPQPRATGRWKRSFLWEGSRSTSRACPWCEATGVRRSPRAKVQDSVVSSNIIRMKPNIRPPVAKRS